MAFLDYSLFAYMPLLPKKKKIMNPYLGSNRLIALGKFEPDQSGSFGLLELYFEMCGSKNLFCALRNDKDPELQRFFSPLFQFHSRRANMEIFPGDFSISSPLRINGDYIYPDLLKTLEIIVLFP